MKILVDELPKYHDDCIFAVRSHMNGKWFCKVNGTLCILAVSDSCPYLQEVGEHK